jgi:hypothetical protein
VKTCGRNLAPLGRREIEDTITKALDADLVKFYPLPRREGNYPSAIVIWHRLRDDTYGTHLAYRNGYEGDAKVRFESGHFDMVSFHEAFEDARKRVTTHGGNIMHGGLAEMDSMSGT